MFRLIAIEGKKCKSAKKPFLLLLSCLIILTLFLLFYYLLFNQTQSDAITNSEFMVEQYEEQVSMLKSELGKVETFRKPKIKKLISLFEKQRDSYIHLTDALKEQDKAKTLMYEIKIVDLNIYETAEKFV